MDHATGVIDAGGSAPKALAIVKMKRVFYKALSYLVLGTGIAVIGVIAVPVIILVMMIMGIWSFLDHILSRLDQKERADSFSRDDQ